MKQQKDLNDRALQRVLMMVSMEGFLSLFLEEQKSGLSEIQAFKKLNDEYRAVSGINRYESLDSFLNRPGIKDRYSAKQYLKIVYRAK